MCCVHSKSGRVSAPVTNNSSQIANRSIEACVRQVGPYRNVAAWLLVVVLSCLYQIITRPLSVYPGSLLDAILATFIGLVQRKVYECLSCFGCLGRVFPTPCTYFPRISFRRPFKVKSAIFCVLCIRTVEWFTRWTQTITSHHNRGWFPVLWSTSMKKSWFHSLFTSVSLYFALTLSLLPTSCLSMYTTPVVNADVKLLSVPVKNLDEEMSVFNSRELAANSLLSPFSSISDGFPRAQRSTEPSASPVRRFQSTTDLLSVYRGRRIHSMDTPSLVPLALTLTAIGLLVLLLLLTFWCIYRKHSSRRKTDVPQKPLDASLQPTATGSSEAAPNCSCSTVETSHSNLVGQVAQREDTAVNNLFQPCIFCLQRCLPLQSLYSCSCTGPLADKCDLEAVRTSLRSDADALSIAQPVPVPNQPNSSACSEPLPVSSLLQDVHKHTCRESSSSPSLATRRRVAPPPLLINLLPSILSQTPPIETCTIQVQPGQTISHSSRAGKSPLPLQMSNLVGAAMDSGSSRASHTLVGSVKGCCPSSIPGFPAPPGQQPRPGTRARVNESVTIFSSPSVSLATSRDPAKGLLESRRGSHTSLTLSLSRPGDVPMLSACSVGSPGTVGRGGSLDEESDLAETELCCPTSSLPMNVFPSTVISCHSANSVTDSSDHHKNSACDSHFYPPADTFVLTNFAGRTMPPVTPNVQGDLSPGDNAHKASDKSSRELPLEPPVVHRSPYPCHHHHHPSRHHHFQPTHRAELSSPCPHNSLSFQRSRDLEQLRNASQPLSSKDLQFKLRDNASALFQEFWNIPMNHASKKEWPIARIGQKNRYQSILPNYSTRVILPMVNNDPLTTYIHANYIHGYGGQPNAFIATQGPMPNTVVDFWRMVWHSRAPAIVMITKLVEKQETKCELYLPNSSTDYPVMSTHNLVATPASAQSSGAGSFTGSSCSPLSSISPSVSDTSSSHRVGVSSPVDSGTTSLDDRVAPPGPHPVECVSPDPSHMVALPGSTQTYGEITVQVESLERFAGYSVRRLRLQLQSEQRKVVHFWYTAWPDHSSPETTPASARQLLQLVQAAESCRRRSEPQETSGVNIFTHTNVPEDRLRESPRIDALRQVPDTGSNLPDFDGPVIVHCSAGLGRTGCFIALCVACDQLKHEGVADVLRIVSHLRLDRGGMVQTNEQYEFIHHALTFFSTQRDPNEPPPKTNYPP
ncbi:hypothetical protein EG68_05884 [Paragonimus skrjabini miyazakii]|uniref:protein-tyrosine-phosphatase n=1 Tax=Paragonimus skrjabini miyazakii TaxID=59628 RepID=A0A8S9Z1H5_9TREM|nr:hypothetical protein EG68_05884 [Paragonimus skrjabini miyazakii]